MVGLGRSEGSGSWAWRLSLSLSLGKLLGRGAPSPQSMPEAYRQTPRQQLQDGLGDEKQIVISNCHLNFVPRRLSFIFLASEDAGKARRFCYQV